MAVSFDGVDDKLECADETAFDIERTSPQSFAGWIYKPTVSGECIGGKATVGPPQRGMAWNTEDVGGVLGISLHLVNIAGNHLFVQSPGIFLSNFWTHFATTYDGSVTTAGVKHYMNGVLQGTPSSTANTITGTILTDEPMRVGGHNTGGGEFWLGSVANFVWDNVEWTPTEVAALANPRNFRAPPSSYLTAAPELWLPLTARVNDSSYNLRDYANGHDASIVGAPTVAGDPEVVIDWGDNGMKAGNFTTSTSFTKVFATAGNGLALLITQAVSGADLISACTVDSIPMTRVQFAQDTVTEPGAVYGYVYFGPLAAGNHTVAITVASGTDTKRYWAVGLNGTADLEVVASGIVQGDTANPSVTLATPVTFSGMVLSALYSGLPNAIDALPTSGQAYTQISANVDLGAFIYGVYLGNKTGANVVAGWTSAIDDVAMLAMAIGARKVQYLPLILFLI